MQECYRSSGGEGGVIRKRRVTEHNGKTSYIVVVCMCIWVCAYTECGSKFSPNQQDNFFGDLEILGILRETKLNFY